MPSATSIFAIEGDIEYLLYRQEHFDDLKNVLYNAFFKNECACIGTEVNLVESEQAKSDLTALSFGALADGVSIVARDVSTNKIISIAINKIQTPGKPDDPAFFDYFKNEKCQSDSSRALIDFMIVLDSQLDLFEHYKIDCLFECMFLATLPGYEGRGIGRRLVHHSIELAKQLYRGESTHVLSDEIRASGIRPSILSAIFTSEYSQIIGRKLGFVEHAKVLYDDLYFREIPYSKRIANPVHRSAVLMSKPLFE